MKKLILFFHLCFWHTFGLYLLKQTNTHSNGYDRKIVVSANGSKMVAANTNGSLSIYQLINGSYQLLQAFTEVQSLMSAFITINQAAVVATRLNSCQVFFYNQSISQYYLFQSIAISSLKRVKLTEDMQNLIAAGFTLDVKNYLYNGTSYNLEQTITPIYNSIIDVYMTEDSQIMMSGGLEKIVRIYSRNGTIFNLLHSINTNISINQLVMPQDRSYVIVAGVSFSEVYRWNGVTYIYERGLATSASTLYTIGKAQSLYISQKRFSLAGTSLMINIYRQVNLIFNSYQNVSLPSATQTVKSTSFDDLGAILAVTSGVSTYLYYECSLSHCIVCLINYCSICQSGYDLVDGSCIPQVPATVNSTVNSTINSGSTSIINQANDVSNLDKNSYNLKDICAIMLEGSCVQYCDQSCSKCHNDKYKCEQCSQLYTFSDDGTCKIEDSKIQILTIIVSVLSAIRHFKTKSILFFLEDIYLYEYHKVEYKGAPKNIFKAARIIQTEIDEIFNIEQVPFIKEIKSSVKHYFQFANPKYLLVEREDQFLPRKIIGFACQTVPLTILSFLFFKLLFKLLFNYSVSRYFRALSFNGCLAVSLIEGNIQHFAFLGIRNARFFLHEDFSDKLISAFVALFLFFVILYCFSSYFLLRSQYKNNLKYFLDNLFKLPISTWIMLVIYCWRPLLKGLIHSSLFENNELQLLLLGAVDLIVLCFLGISQIFYGIFKSTIAFSFLSVYLITGIPLNLYLWMIGNFYSPENQQITDVAITIILYTRLGSLVICKIFTLLELSQPQKSQPRQQALVLCEILNQQKSEKPQKYSQLESKQKKLLSPSSNFINNKSQGRFLFENRTFQMRVEGDKIKVQLKQKTVNAPEAQQKKTSNEKQVKFNDSVNTAQEKHGKPFKVSKIQNYSKK